MQSILSMSIGPALAELNLQGVLQERAKDPIRAWFEIHSQGLPNPPLLNL